MSSQSPIGYRSWASSPKRVSASPLVPGFGTNIGPGLTGVRGGASERRPESEPGDVESRPRAVENLNVEIFVSEDGDPVRPVPDL